MSILKTTIAAAAFTACCLGNDYPAGAELSRNQVKAFRAGKHTGYAMGLVAGGCVSYADGSISRSQYREIVDIASTLDDTNQAMRDYIVETMSNEAHSSPFHKCASVVEQVMRRPRAYRPIETWN